MEENNSKRRRERGGERTRFLSCAVEAQEEMKEYADQHVIDSTHPQQNERGGSSSRSKKQLSSKTQEKTYGWVPRVKPKSCSLANDEKNESIQLENEDDRSPPAKVQKWNYKE